MKNPITWLRICYWWGILADAVMAFLMLTPSNFLRFMNLTIPEQVSFRYGLLNAAPLMIGWTLLLFWADRKPLERKDILLLTLPVIAGYVLVELDALLAGIAPLGAMLVLFIQQAGLMGLFVFSYWNARLSESPARRNWLQR